MDDATMIHKCCRCGYEWAARTENPKRCPSCKSTKWYKDAKVNKCLRCGAEWIQRSKLPPKFCPVCHSGMWNSEKYTFTCPKCGRTRTLRSNSRPGKCPVCDRYIDLRPKQTGFAEFHPRVSGISRMVRVWSDGKGLTISVIDDGRYMAYLFDGGELVSGTSFAPWCRNNSVSLGGFLEGKPTPGSDEKLKELALSLQSKGITDEGKVDNVRELRGVSREQAEIIYLHDSGMDPLPIALKMGITYSEVIDTLTGSHPISGRGISPSAPQQSPVPERDRMFGFGHERA